MMDQRSSGRRLVRWRAAVMATNEPDKVIASHVTEIAAKGISLFCTQQLHPHLTYRVLLQIPEQPSGTVTYVEVFGKPIFSSLVGRMGEFRTGLKLTEVSNEYRTRIDQWLRGG